MKRASTSARDMLRMSGMRGFSLFLASAFAVEAASDPGELLENFEDSLPLVHRSSGFAPDADHPGWMPRKFVRSPAGGQDLLGTFKTEEKVTLKLGGLPAHDCLLVRLDLVILCHWDGVWKAFGPDLWQASLENGPRLLETTFSNYSGARQNFPDETGAATHEWLSGSMSHGNLGWTLEMGEGGEVWKDLDTTYRIWLAVPHDTPGAKFVFSGTFHDDPDPPELRGECWAIAGCEVRAVPAGARPSEEVIDSAVASGFNPGGLPHAAVKPLLVLGGDAGLSRIEEALGKAGLSRLIRPVSGIAPGKAGRALPAEVIRDLGNDDFKTRELASRKLKELLPIYRKEILTARDTSQDPEVRDRIDRALREDQQARMNDAAPREPDAGVVFKERLARILHLQNSPRAARWLEYLELLETMPPE